MPDSLRNILSEPMPLYRYSNTYGLSDFDRFFNADFCKNVSKVPSSSNSLEDIEGDEIQRAIEASKMDQSSSSGPSGSRGPLPFTPPQQNKIKALKSMIKCNDDYAAELLEETNWDPNAAALKYLTSAMAHSPNNSPTAPTGSARPRKRSKHS